MRPKDWTWIPSLNFIEGLPLIAVTVLSVQLYFQMGLDDASITFFTAWLYLPWVLKPLWNNWVHSMHTRRWWTVVMQLVIALTYVGVAFTIQTDAWLQWSMAFLLLSAVASAIHDDSSDAFYRAALSPLSRRRLGNARSLFYNLSMILGKGVLIMVAGVLQVMYRYRFNYTWSLVFFGLAGVFIVFFIWHQMVLPRPDRDYVIQNSENRIPTTTKSPTQNSNFKTPNFSLLTPNFKLLTPSSFGLTNAEGLSLFLFLLLYRLPQGLVAPVAQLFLQSTRSSGGLGLSPQEFGFVSGTVGVVGIIIGNALGSHFVRHEGMRQWLWPMAVATVASNVLFVWLAYAMPSDIVYISLLYLLFSVDSGFGMSACLRAASRVCHTRRRSDYYALTTSVLALSLMIPSFFAGAMSDMMGYRAFFVIVLLSGVAPIIGTALARKHLFPAL